MMLPLTGGIKIYYCRTPINLHRSFDGLPGAVQQYLHEDPLSGHMFVFFNPRKNSVKLVAEFFDSGKKIAVHRTSGLAIM